MRPITKNDYNVWREDPVTVQFMAELLASLTDERERYIVGTPDAITRIVHARNEAMQIYEGLLRWQPQELLNQEE